MEFGVEAGGSPLFLDRAETYECAVIRPNPRNLGSFCSPLLLSQSVEAGLAISLDPQLCFCRVRRNTVHATAIKISEQTQRLHAVGPVSSCVQLRDHVELPNCPTCPKIIPYRTSNAGCRRSGRVVPRPSMSSSRASAGSSTPFTDVNSPLRMTAFVGRAKLSSLG